MAFKKIKILFVIMALALSFVSVGCGESYNAPEGIIGEWTCAETASDGYTDTSFYALSVKDDGSFDLRDRVSGEDGISGNMYCDDTGNLGIINIECDPDSFNPPVCWNISENARVRYKVLDRDTIKLGYTGIWLIFHRD